MGMLVRMVVRGAGRGDCARVSECRSGSGKAAIGSGCASASGSGSGSGNGNKR